MLRSLVVVVGDSERALQAPMRFRYVRDFSLCADRSCFIIVEFEINGIWQLFLSHRSHRIYTREVVDSRLAERKPIRRRH